MNEEIEQLLQEIEHDYYELRLNPNPIPVVRALRLALSDITGCIEYPENHDLSPILSQLKSP